MLSAEGLVVTNFFTARESVFVKAGLVTPPAHKGFGSRVIERGLAHELESKHLEYRLDGLVCTVDIPLPRGTRDG